MKHLILDINVLLTLWFGRADCEVVEELVDAASELSVSMWVSASSLPTLEYLSIKHLKDKGVSRRLAKEIVADLMNSLSKMVSVCSNFGVEQFSVYRKSVDFEDAQIALAAQVIHGEKRLVTFDKSFDTMKIIKTIEPSEAIVWMREQPSDITLNFIDLPADYDPITEIAAQHDLLVLSDSAQGFGSEYKGQKTGTFGHATATSFFPAKPLGGYGDGGAIFTNNDDLADKLESIRVHGKGKDKYDNIRIGLNARLDTLQAAILMPKLKIFPQELKAKQLIAEKYTTLLNAQCAKLKTPFIPSTLRSAWAQYSILAENGLQRDKIQQALKNKNIPSMVYYPTPLHKQTAFALLGYQTGDFPISEDISQRIFSLPMHAYLDDQNLEQIVNTIEDSLCP